MKTLLAFPLIALTLSLSACGGVEGDVSEDGIAADSQALTADHSGRFETFTGRDGRFYFHLLAANGQKVLQSQGYASLRSAKNGIATVRANGVYTDPYQLLQAQDGRWYFNLLAGNFHVVATSQMYSTQASAERGIATAAALVKSAVVSSAETGGPEFQLFRGLDGKYYFHLRAGNGEIVLQSQGYSRRASAVSGAASVLSNGVDERRYHVKDAADGQTYFVVTASNGRVIADSETYATRSDAERAVDTVLALLQSGAVAAVQ